MLNQKISQLPDGGALADDDLLVVARGGTNARLAGSAIVDAAVEATIARTKFIYATIAALEATEVPDDAGAVRVDGYYAAGDGGAALWTRAAVQSAGNGKRQSADGAWWELSEPAADVRMLGALGDGTTPDTSAIQEAIDYVAGKAAALRGGIVYFPSGIYQAAGLQLKDLVFLIGDGRGISILRTVAGANTDLLTVPSDASLCGWARLTFDGNKANNLTAGSGIVLEPTGSSDGNSGESYTGKVDGGEDSYKQLVATDFNVGNCREHGIWTEPSNYQIFFDDFTVSHNGKHGLWVRSSDGIYSNFYCEKNDWAGLLGSGSSNKFIGFKTIWNGRTDKTWGGLREQGTRNVFIGGEAQDNYCDGILILGSHPMFSGCVSNTNGYLAVGSEDQSTEEHADIRIGSSAVGVHFDGSVYTYKTAVGTDGLWTTQWPYYFNAYADAQIAYWNVAFDATTYNERPNVHLAAKTIGNILHVGGFASGGTASFYDLSPSSEDGSGTATIRLFRNTKSTDTAVWQLYQPGTANVQHRLGGLTDTLLNQLGGNVIVGNSTTGGAWNTGHLRLGPYRLWVDSTGDLRIKGSAPTSDTDGTVVGTQS